ncbi:MAG: LysM domain-containing protein [Bacteroidia bacterium]
MPDPGTIIYLNKQKKCLFHIVEEGETIGGIAAEYGRSISKVAEAE